MVHHGLLRWKWLLKCDERRLSELESWPLIWVEMSRRKTSEVKGRVRIAWLCDHDVSLILGWLWNAKWWLIILLDADFGLVVFGVSQALPILQTVELILPKKRLYLFSLVFGGDDGFKGSDFAFFLKIFIELSNALNGIGNEMLFCLIEGVLCKIGYAEDGILKFWIGRMITICLLGLRGRERRGRSVDVFCSLDDLGDDVAFQPFGTISACLCDEFIHFSDSLPQFRMVSIFNFVIRSILDAGTTFGAYGRFPPIYCLSNYGVRLNHFIIIRSNFAVDHHYHSINPTFITKSLQWWVLIAFLIAALRFLLRV